MVIIEIPKKVPRIIALDLLRGYFLLVILINHLNRFPGLFDIFSGREQLWTSAAEGFFLISGMLVGIVRGREVKSGKFSLALKKAWHKGLYLYVWAVILTIVFTIVGTHALNHPALKGGIIPIHLGNAGHVIWNTLTLHYIYGWTDFLRFFAVYMMFAPLILFLLYKRLGAIVAVIAVGLYAKNGWNQFLIWQLYFCLGTIVGFYWQQIEVWLCKFPANIRTISRRSLYILALGVLATNLAIVFAYSALNGHYGSGAGELSNITNWLGHLNASSSTWFNRHNFSLSYGAGRILISFLWFSALYIFVRRHEKLFIKYLGWLFIPIGIRPLRVFIFEGILVFITDITLPVKTSFVVNVVINALSITIVWLVARYTRKQWVLTSQSTKIPK